MRYDYDDEYNNGSFNWRFHMCLLPHWKCPAKQRAQCCYFCHENPYCLEACKNHPDKCNTLDPIIHRTKKEPQKLIDAKRCWVDIKEYNEYNSD